MATSTKTTKTQPLPQGAPAAWADTEVLAGVSVADKEELVGRLFRVTAVKQEVAAGGYAQVWVEVEFPDGKSVMFNDSSGEKGVRAEVEEILNNTGKVGEIGEWVALRFICPEGLRVSRYEKEDLRGKMQPARTFYFTRSGQRAEV